VEWSFLFECTDQYWLLKTAAISLQAKNFLSNSTFIGSSTELRFNELSYWNSRT